MSLTLKVFFNEEIRRINVDASSASSFEYLSEKVKSGFGSNLPKQLVFKWKDPEGDLVTFSSDDELLDALSSADNGVLKIFLEKCPPKTPKPAENDPHWPFPGPNSFKMMPHAAHHVSGMEDLNKIFGAVGLAGQAPEVPEGSQSPKLGKGRGAGKTCGGGRCGGKRNAESDEERPGNMFSAEDKQNMKKVIQSITEAAKTSAFEIAGAAAGDCADRTVEVAVRSSIRRAMIVNKTTGCCKKRKASQQIKEDRNSDSEKQESDYESSTSSSEEESATETRDDVPVNKQIRKKAKGAGKKIGKMTYKEVSPLFGKVAGKWAAKAARQSMIISICQVHRMNLREQKREERRSAKKQCEQPEPMESEAVSSSGVYPTLELSAPEASFEIPSEEEMAINRAIQTFVDMGYKPDDWLVTCIREAKGSIPEVFEKLKPAGGQ